MKKLLFSAILMIALASCGQSGEEFTSTEVVSVENTTDTTVTVGDSTIVGNQDSTVAEPAKDAPVAQ
jgi:predicted small lipoprotein YifL